MRKIIPMLAAGLFLTTGCNDLLDVKPVSEITGSGYWNDPGDVTGYLTGIYARFRDGDGNGTGGSAVMNTTFWLEDRGDAFVEGLEGPTSNAWAQNLTEANAPNWINFYAVIHHCNLLLKYAPNIEFGVQTDKDRAIAETLFIRAYTYFTLIRCFGNVPLELEPTESDNKPLLPRAPASEVMQQILEDVETAISLFPEDEFRDKYRASKPACYALKADALLWKAKVLGGGNTDLEAAVVAADLAMPGLTLQPDLAKVHDVENKKNSEIIFALYFERDEKSNNYGGRLKPRDIFVQNATNESQLPYSVTTRARSVYMPSPKAQVIFDEYPNDTRKNHSIISAIAPSGEIIGVFDNKLRGKLHDDDRYFENDIVIYRLGGVILMKAEALAALDRIPEALAEMNKVRNRANIGDYTGPLDKQSVERELLDEYFRELYLELRRWPDLVRFHFGGTINVYDEVPNLNGKNTPLFFPIPRTQIDLNPNLTQTEGY